ncbi:MAG: Ig-like domain-containing protein, partial [Planctomycetota bacterium]
PSAPSAPDLIAASDSGSSSTDNITNVTAPTFSGTAEAGSTVKIYDGGTLVGTGTATGGNYSITTSALIPGVHSITATATDAAGNVSAASSGLSVTIDTTAPSAPSAPDLIAASDSGSSSTDNITNDKSPTLTGTAESDSTVKIFVDGVEKGSGMASAGGVYSITTSNLADGTYTITATATDTAGNVSVVSSGLSITIDTTKPSVIVSSSPNPVSNGSSSTITYQFSETVTGFDVGDTSATRGTLSNFAVVDGDTYTQTYSRTSASSGAHVDVTNNSYTDVAGNAGSGGGTGNLPAGVAGEPINLALPNPSADASQVITITVAGMPSDWTLNAGTNNGDGTWIVQTSDPGTLTVTTPATYSGALVLGVSMNWTNADGSAGNVFVASNVEAYAPGNPIFALSSDDNLTGSSGSDLFVFADPSAQNVIHNFDVANDQIDLIGFAGANGYGDLTITNDGNGNAVISFAAGSTITVKGVDASVLSEGNFMFNVDPVTVNTGTITLHDGSMMPLGGMIENSGLIALGSADASTSLEILFRGVTLSGGGQVTLSDSSQNVIFASNPASTLTNLDNTLSGAGQIGLGQMHLVNAGTILANGVNALVIDTGSNIVTNSGTLRAIGSGVLIIESGLANSGNLRADGGSIIVNGDVTGSGSAAISGAGIIEFGATSSGNVIFADDAAGKLVLGNSTGFTGTISGFDAGNTLVFGDVVFDSSVLVRYTANDAGTGGMLTVSDGAQTVQITVVGEYAAAGLQLNGQGSGTLMAYDAAAVNHIMTGGLSNDVLTGGGGNDILVGGAGADILTGGTGSDTFVFLKSDPASVDTIMDFNTATLANGGDLLNIQDLLTGFTDLPGTLTLSDLVTSGHISFVGNSDNANTLVQFDSNGSTAGGTTGDLALLQGLVFTSPSATLTSLNDNVIL